MKKGDVILMSPYQYAKQRIGFVGKTRSGELDLIMNIKQYKVGSFLSLVISYAFRRGMCTICVPMVEGAMGWEALVDALRRIVPGVNGLVEKV